MEPLDDSVVRLILTLVALLVAVGVWVDVYNNGTIAAALRAAVALAMFTAARLIFGRAVITRPAPAADPATGDAS